MTKHVYIYVYVYVYDNIYVDVKGAAKDLASSDSW